MGSGRHSSDEISAQWGGCGSAPRTAVCHRWVPGGKDKH